MNPIDIFPLAEEPLYEETGPRRAKRPSSNVNASKENASSELHRVLFPDAFVYCFSSANS